MRDHAENFKRKLDKMNETRSGTVIMLAVLQDALKKKSDTFQSQLCDLSKLKNTDVKTSLG